MRKSGTTNQATKRLELFYHKEPVTPVGRLASKIVLFLSTVYRNQIDALRLGNVQMDYALLAFAPPRLCYADLAESAGASHHFALRQVLD